MKFIFETDQKVQPKFSDVCIDQFFVKCDGDLCQKIEDNCYNMIADCDGVPCAFTSTFYHPDSLISRILPKVIKIEF
jgi:hypothetical protein